MFVDWFGSTNFSFLVVICGFIGALGLGAVLSAFVTHQVSKCLLTLQIRLRKPTSTHAKPLLTYGVLELLVAATCLLTPLGALVLHADWGVQRYVSGPDGVARLSATVVAGELAVGLLCVSLPAFFMGATYPLLCKAIDAYAKSASSLYAANTFGACASILLTQFWLLPTWGHQSSFWLFVAINAGLGLYFVLRPRLLLPGLQAKPEPPTSPFMKVFCVLSFTSLFECGANRPFGAKQDDADQKDLSSAATEPVPASAAMPTADATADKIATSSRGSFSTATLISLAVVSGFATGALEGDVVKRMWFLQANSGAAMACVTFWAIVGIFAASLAVRRLKFLGLTQLRIAYICAIVVYGLAWLYAYPLRDLLQLVQLGPTSQWLANQPLPPEQAHLEFHLNLGLMFVFIGLFVAPAFFALSLVLPWLCNAVQHSHRLTGWVYGSNTVAFCGGVICFAWLAPSVNIFYSTKLLFATLVIAALALFAFKPQQSGRAVTRRWIAIAAAALVASLAVPRHYDADYHDPSDPYPRFPVRALKSNGAHTTYVLAVGDGDRLYFDGHSMSSTTFPAQLYMRLMAHIPLLAQPAPTSALLIGYGVGNTASGILSHQSMQNLVVVELNPNVLETAPQFANINGAPYDDPRTTLINDDGRNFLRHTDAQFDLITSEPPPPKHDGVYRLYSVEYYQDAAAHLSDTGFVSQWLPSYQLSSRANELAISTFLEVFPHTILVAGYAREYLLIGRTTPFDLKLIEARFQQASGARKDLLWLRVGAAKNLFARIVMGPTELNERFGGGGIISDLRNDLAYETVDPRNPTLIPYDPIRVLQFLETHQLASFAALEASLSHLGRLRYLAPDFPMESLLAIDKTRRAQLTMGDASWRDIGSALNQYHRARNQGNQQQAINLLKTALEYAPEQPYVRLELAYRYLEQNAPELALAQLEGALILEPRSAEITLLVGHAHARLGQWAQALDAYRQSGTFRPSDARSFKGAGDALRELGQDLAAANAYQQALALEPTYVAAAKSYTHLMQALAGTRVAPQAKAKAKTKTSTTPGATHGADAKVDSPSAEVPAPGRTNATVPGN